MLRIEQTIEPAIDAYEPQRVQYAAEAPLGARVTSLSLEAYPKAESGNVRFLLADKSAAAPLQDTLKKAGFESRCEDRNSGHNYVVADIRARRGVMDVALALAASGDMMPATASQIIDHELARLGQTVSEAEFASFRTVTTTGERFGSRAPVPRHYQSVDITHPLSAVLVLDEDGDDRARIAADGTRVQETPKITHITARSERDAVAVIETLKLADITVDAPLNAKGLHGPFKVDATAEEVALALAARGKLPASIAEEIHRRAEELNATAAGRVTQRRSGGEGRSR